MRIVRWLGLVLWAGSWYLMYLEITRWRHVKPSLEGLSWCSCSL